MHAGQVADASRERREFLGDLGRRFRFALSADRRLSVALHLRFEQTPLAAEFRLTGGAAGDHCGIVTGKGDLADFETVRQVAKKQEPGGEQVGRSA